MNLKLGSTGPDVIAWQKLVLPDHVTGYFGALTEEATKVWQRAHGLDDDGTVGPLTISMAVGAPPRVEGIDVSSANTRVNYARVR